VKIRNKRGKMIKTLKPKNTIHKVVKTAVAALAGLGMLLNVGMNTGCKTADINNHDPQAYYLTVHLQDVFTNSGLGGRVVVNGTDGQSGYDFKINGNKVNTIEVEVDGYKRTYVLGEVGGDIVFFRDKNGPSSPYSMSSNRTMYAKLVPNDFDTVTLAKSIGNHIGNGDTLGDGTVIRYDKRNIDVALWEAEVAAGDAEQNLKDAIDMININNSIITLNYKGKVNSYITNGVTHIINENQNPVHAEEFDKKTNIISRSYLKTMPTTSFGTILAELLQASSGLRADGGTDKCVYQSQGKLINDASRAIYLVNFSPPGLQYSPNNPDPASSQNIMVFTTVADQIQEDAHGNPFEVPFGGNRMPSDYNGPGRFQHKRADKNHRR
jgi:hypothetical protein